MFFSSAASSWEMLDLQPVMTPSLGWLGIQTPGFATDPLSLDNPTANWFHPIHIYYQVPESV